MNNIIFHTLTNSSFKFVKTLDVASIFKVYYHKRTFKIIDTKNDFKMIILHDHINWYSNCITFIYYPTEQRCKNEKNEIEFKKNALNKYIKKLQNEILPRGYEETMFDQNIENYQSDIKNKVRPE